MKYLPILFVTQLLPLALLGQVSGQPHDVLSRIRELASSWQLKTEDLASLSLRDHYTSDHNGVEHYYVQQQFQGIPIDKAIAGFHFRGDGSLLFAANGFLQGLQTRISAGASGLVPRMDAREAARLAAQALGKPLPKSARPGVLLHADGIFVFTEPSWSDAPIPVSLNYLPDREGALRLAWRITLDDPDSPDHWVYQVDATTGKVLLRENYTQYCTHSGHHHIGQVSEGSPSVIPGPSTERHAPFGQALLNRGTYRVFPYLLASPLEGPRQLLADPADGLASPFGWHDTNGASGAEYTHTRGNNVHAYLDRDADNNPDDLLAEGNAGLLFDFPMDMAKTPDNQAEAALTQLFYMNNFMHDFSYRYGFNEEAGNFQQNLYGKAGKAGDAVKAEAQDGTGFNNANFSTPPDGASARMQMYIWMPGEGKALTITTPSSLAGTYNVGLATFGPAVSSTPISGTLIIAQDSVSSALACGTLTNASAVKGKILVVDRGTCKFKDKVIRAEAAGALAVIVCNTTNEIITMGSDGTTPLPKIPVVLLPSTSGNSLKNSLRQGQTVRATLQANPGDLVIRDASFDNGIVAHEYGHGISNRLTGGPSFTSCLTNDEQMGEGWSDFFTLITSVKPGDNGKKGRAIGDYSENNPKGIRRQLYSTDFSVNNQTYDDIIGTTAPHPLGEIWAATLWDIYWKMADKYGFDPDLLKGKGGNNKAIQLVMDGMKFQNCNPGFIDGRDAILAADFVSNKGENECLLWEVFARRGLGFSAKQNTASNRNDNWQAFDVKPSCIKTLKLEKDMSPSIVLPGDTLTVRINLYNHQNKPALNLRLRDVIPAGCRFLPGSLQGGRGAVVQGDTLTFSVSDLGIGESLALFYRLTTEKVVPSRRIFRDEMEKGDSDWSVEPAAGSKDLWTRDTRRSVSGQFSWNIANGREATDVSLRLKVQPDMRTAALPVLSFLHRYEIDPGKDGGFLEYSLNGGTSWQPMPDSLFLRKGYDGRLDPRRTTGFVTRAYWGESPGYETTLVRLSPFRTENMQFRWHFIQAAEGSEDPRNFEGWSIDDVEVLDASLLNSQACATASDGATGCGTARLGGGLVAPALQTPITAWPSDAPDIRIFPNPGGSELNLELQGGKARAWQCTIRQLTGQPLQEVRIPYLGGTQTVTLSVQDAPPGVYLVDLLSAEGRKVIRWIKQ